MKESIMYVQKKVIALVTLFEDYFPFCGDKN